MASVNGKTLKEIQEQMRPDDAAGRELVARAYAFSEDAHKEQQRYSGAPYFTHVSEVAYLLAVIGMDATTIAAGLLHDTIEDGCATEEGIREQFGEEVFQLVDGVTKLGTIRYHGLERHAESLRKLFAATAQDLRVLIIKLMDRLHNTRTLAFVPKEKQQRIALETLEIYAPIADRLGMSAIKRELEDNAFPFAYPEEYRQVRELLKERSVENEKRLGKIEKDMKKLLAENGIRKFKMETRKKGIYSLFRKLERKKWDITQIHDILALRVIVPTLADCYTVLGLVHGQWRPLPGKIKDYIASPKPNGYQSIHTTVYTGDGGALEIQIRSEAMHQEAEYGIASHLTYKESTGYHTAGRRGSGLEWVRQFIPGLPKPQHPGSTPALPAASPAEIVPRWVRELASARADGSEYIGDLKNDFFSHRIFTFTPKNDVIDLPLGASPIDFAYAVHSDIGNRLSGAKVNGKLASLGSQLQNGDIVEIITKPSAKPTTKWLEMAKTSLARRHIKSELGLDTPHPMKHSAAHSGRKR
ncbi:MAG TPA: HD domain-containing protein [Candidatus Paceibacterota bacterium]|nr:HD domain-containing protein [Candidatus Paceibacterota bacterium]